MREATTTFCWIWPEQQRRPTLVWGAIHSHVGPREASDSAQEDLSQAARTPWGVELHHQEPDRDDKRAC